MKISCIVPARNEASQVIPTLTSLREGGADEIILIDDGSETDHACHLPEARALADTLIHYKTARGPAHCRNVGAEASTGDILVFCDCHVRCRPGSLRQFGMTAEANQGWVNASIQPLDPASGKTWTKYGGAFNFVGGGYEILYRNDKPAEPVSAVTALIGAFYAVPREVFFSRMGQWPLTISHGYNEQGVSMGAFFTGIPMVVDTGMVVQHQFKKTYNYDARTLFPHINRYLVHFVLFSKDTFRDYWIPEMEKKFNTEKSRCRTIAPAMAMIKSPEWQERHEKFQALKKRTDQEFFDMVKNQGNLSLSGGNRETDGK